MQQKATHCHKFQQNVNLFMSISDLCSIWMIFYSVNFFAWFVKTILNVNNKKISTTKTKLLLLPLNINSRLKNINKIRFDSENRFIWETLGQFATSRGLFSMLITKIQFHITRPPSWIDDRALLNYSVCDCTPSGGPTKKQYFLLMLAIKQKREWQHVVRKRMAVILPKNLERKHLIYDN